MSDQRSEDTEPSKSVPTATVSGDRQPQRQWFLGVAERLENAAMAANADAVADMSHGWAQTLLELYGERATRELIEDYCAWVAAKDDDARSDGCRKTLTRGSSDPQLDGYDRLRLIFSYISGPLEDAAYLETMDSRLERHVQIKDIKTGLSEPNPEADRAHSPDSE